jgi:hypothetical protein
MAFVASCGPSRAGDGIPDVGDWRDCGVILESGGAGAWDRYLWGGFAASVVKRDGRYLLYYQGSDGYHEEEATVTNRAIGVATSSDGVRFDKHADNPVLTFSPRGNHEEGAVSSAVLVDGAGGVVLYYGANTWAGGEEVNATARRAVAADGLRFEDQGVVLDWRNRAIWGHGDEIFPVGALRDGARDVLFYIPNGTRQRGRLGVAWSDGDGWRSAAARSGLGTIPVWGPASVIHLEADTYALFLTYVRERSYMEVRLVTARRPARLSRPVRHYEWDDVNPMSVLEDHERQRWLLYYRTGDHARYGVMVAPVRAGKKDAVVC